jgi:hypothetical protein
VDLISKTEAYAVPQLNSINEVPQENDITRVENSECGEELGDRVDDLPQVNSEHSEHSEYSKNSEHSAVPSTKSRKSHHSSNSTQFIAKLEAKIARERIKRESMQKEIEEMKKFSTELLSQLESKNNG